MLSNSLLLRLNYILQRIEHAFPILFGGRFPPGALCLLDTPHTFPPTPNAIKPSYTLKDLIGDGFLWAVPRNRRTIEKRWKRKYGTPEYSNKLLLPKTTLRVCNQCGHDHEVGILCAHCYEKVRLETSQMQEQIQKELGLSPVDQEVIVLYEGEKGEQPSEFWNGKRVVEMDKPRPMWFSKNLLQKTTQPAATTKEVKKTDLG